MTKKRVSVWILIIWLFSGIYSVVSHGVKGTEVLDRAYKCHIWGPHRAAVNQQRYVLLSSLLRREKASKERRSEQPRRVRETGDECLQKRAKHDQGDVGIPVFISVLSYSLVCFLSSDWSLSYL